MENLDNLESRTLAEYPNYLILENGVILSKIAHGNNICKTWVNYRGQSYGLLVPHVWCMGYSIVSVRTIKNTAKTFRVHTLVALAFLGERPKHKNLIRHLDSNKQNNHYSNLAYGTDKENYADHKSLGKPKKIVKISVSQKHELVGRYFNGEVLHKLSSEYGVSLRTATYWVKKSRIGLTIR